LYKANSQLVVLPYQCCSVHSICVNALSTIVLFFCEGS